VAGDVPNDVAGGLDPLPHGANQAVGVAEDELDEVRGPDVERLLEVRSEVIRNLAESGDTI
jgi:hypothetical protein